MAETGIGSHGQISDVHSDAIREPRRPAKLLEIRWLGLLVLGVVGGFAQSPARRVFLKVQGGCLPP